MLGQTEFQGTNSDPALRRNTIPQGEFMKSLFLEGLQSAREIVQNKGIAHLDRIIDELEKGTIETTTLAPEMETR